MGSFSTKEFREILEEDYPATPVQNKRVLQEDPRSPSTLITRTPIHVEKTPESILDPRSPTVGINRTPIYGGKTVSKTGAPVSQLAVETPTRPPPTDVDVQDDSGCQCEQPEGGATEGAEATTSFMGKLDGLETESFVADTTAAKPLPPLERNSVIKRRKALFKHSNISPGDPNATSGQRSSVKVSSIRSPLRTTVGESQRSPLAMRNRDIDSPRVIVQRKQSNKLGLVKGPRGNILSIGNRSPSRYQKLSKEDDKENISS